MKTNIFGITILELIMSLVLLSFVILGFNSFTMFSRSQVLGADRRMKIANNVFYVLEHMQKYISRGIGSRNDTCVDIAGSPARIRIRWYKNGLSGPSPSKYLAYYYKPSGGGAYDLKFFADYPASGWSSSGGEVISANITLLGFSWMDNYIQVNITGCYDPSQISTCGSELNPNVTMYSRIKMPAVSTN